MCSVVFKHATHYIPRRPQPTTGCSAGASHRLHHPAGGSANERSPHICLARVEAYTSVRMLCAVAWTQYPSRPAPLVGPMTCTDPFRRLITTVSLREPRRSEICNVGGGNLDTGGYRRKIHAGHSRSAGSSQPFFTPAGHVGSVAEQ